MRDEYYAIYGTYEKFEQYYSHKVCSQIIQATGRLRHQHRPDDVEEEAQQRAHQVSNWFRASSKCRNKGAEINGYAGRNGD